MRKPHFDVQLVIMFLLGTAHTLEVGLNLVCPGMVVDDLTAEEHEKINNQIYECEICGWWCEVEQGEERFCGACGGGLDYDPTSLYKYL